MRIVALLCLAAVAAACADGGGAPASVSAETSVVGPVVASRRVIFFLGDQALVAYSHVVESRERPESRVTVVTSFSDCPVIGNSEQIYAISYRPTRIVYGMNNEEDRRWHTSLEIVSCTPIER